MCDCELIQMEFFCETWHRARKPRKCIECHKQIPVGDRYSASRSKQGGKFRAWSTCETCMALVQRIRSMSDEHLSVGDLIGTAKEMGVEVV